MRSTPLLVLALGCACGASPAPASTVTAPTGTLPTDPLLRDVCPDVTGRAVGDYASVVALYERLGDDRTPEGRIMALCAPETTDRAFAHGTYGLAVALPAADHHLAVQLIEALAREYAEPQALGELATAHARGTAEIPVDIGAAYCEARAAMTIANSIGAVDGDRSFSSSLLGVAMPFVTTAPEAMGAGPEVTTESIQACVAGHVAHWEAHFGHVMSDHEINEAEFERARRAEPPLDDWAACPCEQLVETPDGSVCAASIRWTRGEDGPEVCFTFRTHAPAAEDVAYTLELRGPHVRDEGPPDARIEVAREDGRSGAARVVVVRRPHPVANTSVHVMAGEEPIETLWVP